jgi:arylsulfatase A-like enzyme
MVTTLWLLLCLLQPAWSAPRMNLISIVTDDQSEWSVGAYGNKESRTPNMDRLAREGARFANAFTCTPVCSPSRAAFLTGRYGTHLGITDWITPKQGQEGLGLPTNVVTWPRLLQQNGWRTALIGKWHLGSQETNHPTRLGFDTFFGALGGSFRPKDPELERDGQLTKVDGFGADILTDAALQFIETNRAAPFALLIHYREPHLPYTPVPDVDAAPFASLDPTVPIAAGTNVAQVKEWTRAYYAAIHSVDRNLGRILALLDQLNLATNTIVMFTSDHGYMIGHHGLHSKGNAYRIDKVAGAGRQTRPNMFEESLRIPWIVRWPGVTKPAHRIPQRVSNIDTHATVVGMLGLKQPADAPQEGIDLSPLLRGKVFTPRNAIFAQYDLQNDAKDSMRMIRTRDWKLVRHAVEGADELFNLRQDPGELRNLYSMPEFAKTRARLQKRLTEWQQKIDDPLLAR